MCEKKQAPTTNQSRQKCIEFIYNCKSEGKTIQSILFYCICSIIISFEVDTTIPINPYIYLGIFVDN